MGLQHKCRVCRVLAVDFLAHFTLYYCLLCCNQTLETNFCSRYFIIATYKNPPQVCCGFDFVFSGRNSNVQNRGFVFCRYKTVEGTITYATKDVELCCL